MTISFLPAYSDGTTILGCERSVDDGTVYGASDNKEPLLLLDGFPSNDGAVVLLVSGDDEVVVVAETL